MINRGGYPIRLRKKVKVNPDLMEAVGRPPQ